ncbi:MaoC/PaaZ C-terminal domain-containing protein [uncultured Pseudoramibacter sp.]|uniref:MaoC/PaaZ C-terminal domain-containing protein n=1 Tax=uncultured Pseudoramibacter sp. TaxID=1623493 RepID=UPI0025D6F259|nr:MaoC/PaaZ C-terminal domain-containing protein [uncultured Pseudoramibacter sp.]
MIIQNLDKKLIGLKMEPRTLEYNWRDVALYALAVGAGSDDLMYTYEKNLKALPTFGTIPYWGTVNVRPRQWMPRPASMFADELIKPTISFLNMDHEIIFHRPIDPIKGTFQWQDEITDVYDRGEGKGAVVKTKCVVRDEAGRDICTNFSTTFFHEAGGFGGRPMPKSSVMIPERAPDFEMNDIISPVQNLLYRLTGDTNLVHVDPEYAKKMGFEKPFMQGLCSFGFCCRHLVAKLIPGEPERARRMAAQMTAVLYPDTAVKIQIWKISENVAYFRFLNAENGDIILNRGIFEYQ